MSLAPGTRLGSYEVVSALGAGGMGEVYRARDMRLDRDVAIKVLPSHLSKDPDALARFEREAKAVAALSHPNILAIHDFGRDASGTAYAVMELLDGATLRERLRDGALPLAKSARIGVELAHGLAAAHARGLVHRDLKPENVFITADGRVKILDFGLAKGDTRDGPARDGETRLADTTPGTVLGTIGYMAPEQVRGQPTDHRADIFSLGVVLYEMATGQRAFARETTADTMTAILREDPFEPASPRGSAPVTVAASIEPIIRHCLEKQPAERFQSASDLAFALQSISTASAPASASAAGDGPVPARAVYGRRSAGWLLLAGVGIAGAFFAGRNWPAAGPAPASSRALAFQQVTDDAGVESDPTLSADGTSLAFTRSGRQGDVFVQRVGGRTPIPIAADPNLNEGGPAFSPDGASIAFHVIGGPGGIFIAGATGESARRVSDFGFHPAWSPDGRRIVFCTEFIGTPLSRISTSALWVVDAQGGAPPVRLFEGDAVEPAWSPNNLRLAFWAVPQGGQRDLFTIPAAGGQPVAVTNDAAVDWGPKWSGDGRHLYFASDRGGVMNIWRVAIDESSGVPQGDPEPVTQGVIASEQVTLSRDGSRIAFRSSQASANPSAIPFDETAERLGAPRALFDRTGNLVPTAASPDGNWLAYWNLGDRHEDVFISRPDGTGLRRLTDDVARDRFPTWTPDSRELMFYSNRTGPYNIFAVRADGSNLRAVTDESGGNQANLNYPVLSPSGDRLIASHIRTNVSLLIDPRKPWSAQVPERLTMAIDDRSFIVPNQWSPDGKRLLGPVMTSSGVLGGVAIYDLAAKQARRVSSDSTDFFGYAWLGDSRRILYAAQDQIVLMDVDTGRRKAMFPGHVLGFGLVLSPDRKTVYVSIFRQQADIWLGAR